VAFNPSPACRHQSGNCQRTVRDLLLVAQILVGRDIDLVPVILRLPQKLTVLEPAPTELIDCSHNMVSQQRSKRYGRALIEQDPHLRNFERARRVFKDGANLLQRNSGEPLDEVGDLRTVFKVLKERSDGHTVP
jgi:hypothetical protein